MTTIKQSRARAVADLAEGEILASVEIAAPPERVFRALASKEIVDWWVRPGVFNTTERTLVFTWHRVGTPGAPTTVSCRLEAQDGGTRLTLRHSGFTVSAMCDSVSVGWETSFERLVGILAARTPGT